MAWLISGVLKVPIEYLETRKWNWALWFSPGGMPSPHSSPGDGQYAGGGACTWVQHRSFAMAFTLMMVVVYDAAGVRRQAGLQPPKINQMINELFAGHPISEDQLKEVLGHTPRAGGRRGGVWG